MILLARGVGGRNIYSISKLFDFGYADGVVLLIGTPVELKVFLDNDIHGASMFGMGFHGLKLHSDIM